eukprot:188851-Rhodomonas_salina.1
MFFAQTLRLFPWWESLLVFACSLPTVEWCCLLWEMFPNSLSHLAKTQPGPMIADQVNWSTEERDEGQSSSAASASPSAIEEASAAGKRKRKRLPVDQCSAAALRMRQMRERREQEKDSGQSNLKESLKFFSINVDQALTIMQIIVKRIQSNEISRQLNNMAMGVTLSEFEPEQLFERAEDEIMAAIKDLTKTVLET